MVSEETGGKSQPEQPDAPTLDVYEASASCWLQRPQLAVHVATIAHSWTILENELAMLFTFLIGGNRQAIAAMFHSVVSMPTRIEMLKNIAKDKFNTEVQKELASLCDRLRWISRRRNNVIHGLWALRAGEPDVIFLADLFRSKDPIPYRVNDFVKIELQITKLRHDFSEFTRKVTL